MDAFEICAVLVDADGVSRIGDIRIQFGIVERHPQVVEVDRAQGFPPIVPLNSKIPFQMRENIYAEGAERGETDRSKKNAPERQIREDPADPRRT
jgi:hypothetical protein